MKTFKQQLDEKFSLEYTVLKEISTIPTGSLNKILNGADVKRVLTTGDKGNIGELWKQLITALRKNNEDGVKKSLAELIVGYSLMIQFLGQPKNKRLDWINNFLNPKAETPKK
jgi:predicted transcriptional regulator